MRRAFSGGVTVLLAWCWLAVAVIPTASAQSGADIARQLEREAPPELEHLDDFRLNWVTLAGGHNTYQKKGDGNNDLRNDWTGDFNLVVDSLKHTQTIELDLWDIFDRFYVTHDPWASLWDDGRFNENNCPFGGGILDNRNQDFLSCLEALRGWHDRHPNHPLVIVKLEMKAGFWFKTPADLDCAIDGRYCGDPHWPRIPREIIFKPSDLLCKNPPACTARYGSPDEAVKLGGWPSMRQLRGKFMFVMVSGTVSQAVGDDLGMDDGPTTYAAALQDGSAHVVFPALLMKAARAGVDPRTDPGQCYGFFCTSPGHVTYKNSTLAGWNVVFDMEHGYLPPPFGSGDISADRVQWMRDNHYLRFVSAGSPATPCPGLFGDLCRETTLNVMCPTPPLRTACDGLSGVGIPPCPEPSRDACMNEWTQADADKVVALPQGRSLAQRLAADLQFNVIDTDQERLGLVDPQPLTAQAGDYVQGPISSYWVPVDTDPEKTVPRPTGPPDFDTYETPVATWGEGRVEMLTVTDPVPYDPDTPAFQRELWHRSFGPRGWTFWEPIPTPWNVFYSPSIAPLDNGDLMVFVRAQPDWPNETTDDYRVWATYRHDWVWSPWQQLPGVPQTPTISKLAATATASPLGFWFVDLFGQNANDMTANDGQIWHARILVENGGFSVSTVESLGAPPVLRAHWSGGPLLPTGGPPAVAAHDPSTFPVYPLEVFSLGAFPDNAVWHRVFTTSWSPWESLGTVSATRIPGDPVATFWIDDAQTTQQTNLFEIENRFHELWGRAGVGDVWQPWQNLDQVFPLTFPLDPIYGNVEGAVAFPTGIVDVFADTTAGFLHKRFDSRVIEP